MEPFEFNHLDRIREHVEQAHMALQEELPRTRQSIYVDDS